MAYDPEAIQAALFARLSGIASLGAGSVKSRRALSWDDVPAAQQPALICLGNAARANRSNAETTIWTMLAEVVFYVRDPSDKAITVETNLHLILTQVDAKLKKQPGEIQPDDDPGTTLGGLVFRCYRTEHHLHLGVSQGQSAVSMFIEMVAFE